LLIAFWIVAGIAALAFLATGLMKLIRPVDVLQTSGMGWVEDLQAPSVKLIALAEVLGAIGLILPPLTGIAPILSPIAAICLAIIMIGAAVVHIRRHEPPAAPIGLAVLAVAAAVLGFIAVVE
jgi:DoxX-like family